MVTKNSNEEKLLFYEVSLNHPELGDPDILENGGYDTTVKLDKPFDSKDENRLYEMIYDRVFDEDYDELLHDVFEKLGYDVQFIL